MPLAFWEWYFKRVAVHPVSTSLWMVGLFVWILLLVWSS